MVIHTFFNATQNDAKLFRYVIVDGRKLHRVMCHCMHMAPKLLMYSSIGCVPSLIQGLYLEIIAHHL